MDSRRKTPGFTGWYRLALLLIKIGQFDKAKELYNVLLDQTSDEREKAFCYNQLGYVKNDQGEYETSIWYFEKVLEINQKMFPPNNRFLSSTYINIGEAYGNMSNYSKALSFYEKAP